jgi:hypothetical protein
MKADSLSSASGPSPKTAQHSSADNLSNYFTCVRRRSSLCIRRTPTKPFPIAHLISFRHCPHSITGIQSLRLRDGATSRVEQWLFTLAARRSSTTHEGGTRHSLDDSKQNNRVRTVLAAGLRATEWTLPMTTRNVPESSVSSYRFVSRPAAQPPIFWLVRRGKGSLGYSSSGTGSPNIPQENGPRSTGPRDRGHRDRHLFNSERLGSEVSP